MKRVHLLRILTVLLFMGKESFDKVTGRLKLIQGIINLIPKGFRLRLNPRRYAIETFVKNSAKTIKNDGRVLDAGAGPCPYKKFFNHCKYESTDFVDNHKCLDFVCSLINIPRNVATYDAVINTEVLEHVEYPQQTINELCRILKKGGKLFLTTPQSWRIHQAPHNYFYFTHYGLASLLKNAGFSKYKITPMGGYFWFIADVIRFNNLLEQLSKNNLLRAILAVIGYPITQILIPLILFHMDFLDKKRDWTMGYTVEAIK